MAPVFSGSGIDPQDVKVISDPVQYVVFDGMNGKGLRRVVLVAAELRSCAQEKAVESIGRTTRKSHTEFASLRVTGDGAVEREA